MTKGFSALPRIVSAMKRGRIIKKLADSRLENIIDLRKLHFSAEHDVVEASQAQFGGRCHHLRRLQRQLGIFGDQSAFGKGGKEGDCPRRHFDDRRGGISGRRLPEEAVDLAGEDGGAEGRDHSRIGTNMAVYGGILPVSEEPEHAAGDKKTRLRRRRVVGIRYRFRRGTSSLKLVDNGTMPAGVNQLRIGEGILLGTDTTHNFSDSLAPSGMLFLLKNEVIEVKSKPSVPIGETGRDAFGKKAGF